MDWKMKDYAEPLIELQQKTKQLHDCLLHGDQQAAFQLTFDIEEAVAKLRNYCWANVDPVL